MHSWQKKTAALAVSALGVSACSTGRPPPVRVELLRPSLPPAALSSCSPPQLLPQKDLSDAEATRYWARDRAALKACETKRQAAVQAVSQPLHPDPVL